MRRSKQQARDVVGIEANIVTLDFQGESFGFSACEQHRYIGGCSPQVLQREWLVSIDRGTRGGPTHKRRSDNNSIADDDVRDDNVNNDDDNNDEKKKNFNSNIIIIIIIIIILTAIVIGTIIVIKNQSNALNMYLAQNSVLFIVNENSTMNNQVGSKREEGRRGTGGRGGA